MHLIETSRLITVQSQHKKQVVDITPHIESFLDYSSMLCHLFIKHTTAALTTADLDPGTDLDMLDAIEAMIPKLKYRHEHNPEHVGDHIMASLIGSSLVLPLDRGKVVLGQWQRVVLVELDGPRVREIVMTLFPGQDLIEN